jgi:hypothetical protein
MSYISGADSNRHGHPAQVVRERCMLGAARCTDLLHEADTHAALQVRLAERFAGQVILQRNVAKQYSGICTCEPATQFPTPGLKVSCAA